MGVGDRGRFGVLVLVEYVCKLGGMRRVLQGVFMLGLGPSVYIMGNIREEDLEGSVSDDLEDGSEVGVRVDIV